MSGINSVLKDEFDNVHFARYKSERRFSAIAIDPAHEQHIAQIKGVGGIKGLTDNPPAIMCWMIAGPEMAKLLEAYEASVDLVMPSTDSRQHEHSSTVQSNFQKEVSSLVDVMKDLVIHSKKKVRTYMSSGPKMLCLQKLCKL